MASRRRTWGWLPFLFWGVVWIGLLGGETFASRHTVGWVAQALPFLPAGWVAGVEFGLRKVLHFLAYAVLGFLAGRAVVRRWGASPEGRDRLIGAAGLLGAVALLDEGHQQLVRGRHPSFVDVLLDVAGGAAGILAAFVMAGGLRRRRRDSLSEPQ